MNSRQPFTRRSGRTEEDGLALVLALLFVVLLTAIVVDFAYEMQVDASLVQSQTSDYESYLAAKSAVAVALGALASDLIFGEEEAESADYEVYDSLDEPWAERVPLQSLNGAVMDATITDEYGKINLNALVFGEESGSEEVFEPLAEALTILFEVREADVIPVDAILDWLDSDDLPRPGGFENAYYESLENPYKCKNGPMDSIEELLLIPGITPADYFGSGEEGLLPLTDLLTVHGHPEGKINANTAMPEVLEALFAMQGSFADPSAAALEWVDSREADGPARSMQELIDRGLLTAPQPNQQTDPEYQPPPIMLDVASEVFRIQGDGQGGDSQVRIEAFVWRDTHGSGAAQMFRVLEWRVLR